MVFGGYSSKELLCRIQDCKPKILFTASYGVEPHRKVNYKQIVDEAINSYGDIRVVVVDREDG